MYKWPAVIVLLSSLLLSLPIPKGLCSSVKPVDKTADYNIVMVWIDTLRADHLGCYGYQRDVSPNIDQLARESIVFENNHTPHTVTISSFMSIITSLYPLSHGVLFIEKDRLSPKIKTLAEILKIYNYNTIWFGPEGCAHLDPKIGFGRGIDKLGFFPDDLAQGRQLLIDTLKEFKDKKFFLNFHTYKVHDPYFPSAKYKQKITSKHVDGVIESREEMNQAMYKFIKAGLPEKGSKVNDFLGEKVSKDLLQNNFFGGPFDTKKMVAFKRLLFHIYQHHKYSQIEQYVYGKYIDPANPEMMAQLKDLYDATILEFDSEIMGPLLRCLKDLGIYDKTVVVVCADHGEEFGEHGGIRHGRTLFDEVTHVPFILRLPWLKEGKRIGQLSQTVDILPTLLHLLDIPVPYHAQGMDLSELLIPDASAQPRQYVYGQLSDGQLSIRSKEWKLYFALDHKKMLFNLLADPLEKTNLYNDNFLQVLKLEKVLMHWKDSLPVYKVDAIFSPYIDKKTQERIKKTGYW